MLIAAIYTSAAGVAEREAIQTRKDVKIPHGSVLYDMMLSMLASTFSIFPVIVIYAIQKRNATDARRTTQRRATDALETMQRPATDDRNTTPRPIWLGRLILALIWVLGVTEAFLSLYGNFDYATREESEREAKWNCDLRSKTYWKGMRAAQVLFIVGPIALVVLTIFLLTGFGIPSLREHPFLVICRSYWRLFIAWMNLLAMWALLACFTYIRHKIDHNIQDLNESNE